jgi:hypothetical protein
MDRSGVFKSERCRTVPGGRFVTIEPLLYASGRDGRELRDHASSGRAIYPDAVLWDPEDAPLADRSGIRGQREAGKKAPAGNGPGSDLPEAAIVDTGARPSDLSLPFARIADCAPQSGMGDRYYLYPAAAWVCVSGGGHGLVQPLRSVMGVIRHAGRKLLRDGVGMGVKFGPAGNLQFGSGLAIYERAIHSFAAGPQCPDQHGWPGSGNGQHLRRAPLADDKIRRGLFERLRKRPRGHRESSTLFPVLQSRTNSSIFGLSGSGAGLLSKEASDSNCPKTGHGNDRVAVRSSIVGQYSEKYFSRRTGQAENLEKPVHRTFGKALALFQMSYGLNNGVFSIIMDPQSEATIHLKEAVFLSKEWGTPQSSWISSPYRRY